MVAMHNFRPAHLHALTRNVLVAAGTPNHIADTVTGILVNANLVGHDSHGILRIPAYLSRITDGALQPDAEPLILQEGPSQVSIDGQKGFGHYLAHCGLTMAIEKAKQHDVCCVSLTNNGHIGRLGEYAEIAAQAGCIAIVTTGVGSAEGGAVVPFGGAQGRLSTNPIAVGIPTGDAIPFVLDFATSIVAEGKLQVARSKQADVPAGFIVDKDGNPTTRTLDFYEGGFLLPFGSHKGYALSLLVCLLGGLSGTFKAETAEMSGVFIQVINVAGFTSLENYQQNARAFLDGMKATPPGPGFEEVLVPGDFEQRFRQQRLKEGLEIPETIVDQITEWANRLDASLGEELVQPADVERYEKLLI